MQEEWDRQAETRSALKGAGSFEAYIAENNISMDRAYEGNREGTKTCACIDEGVHGDVRIAGAGILHPGGVEAVAAILRKAGVTAVTSHEGCGAAKLAYSTAHNEGAPVTAFDDATIDRFAREWVEKLAALLKIPARHVRTKEMWRPKEFHNASVVYVHTTPFFHPTSVEGLPPGFVVSWGAMDNQHAEKNVQLAIDIALGAHGFGKYFTADTPFTVVAVGDPDDEVYQKLRARLPGLIAPYGFRVALDHITAPSLAAVENFS